MLEILRVTSFVRHFTISKVADDKMVSNRVIRKGVKPMQQNPVSTSTTLWMVRLTLELEKRRPTPSMQTWRRPPSPDWMSWTGNSPPSSIPGLTPPTPRAAALSMAALIQ